VRKVSCAGQPGADGTPPKPPERARGDVLGYAGTARSAFVPCGIGKRRHLYEIEVKKKPDPCNACQYVQPDKEAGCIPCDAKSHQADYDRQDDASGYNASDRIKWIH
jgi:hypothetical protein